MDNNIIYEIKPNVDNTEILENNSVSGSHTITNNLKNCEVDERTRNVEAFRINDSASAPTSEAEGSPSEGKDSQGFASFIRSIPSLRDASIEPRGFETKEFESKL